MQNSNDENIDRFLKISDETNVSALDRRLGWLDFERWFRGFVTYFRAIGFYSELEAKSDADAAVAIRKLFRNPGIKVRNRVDAEFMLLMLDEQRVFHASDKYYYPKEDAYIELIEGCAQISQGVFNPINIAEEWSELDNAQYGDKAHMMQQANVSFTVNGRHYEKIVERKYIDSRAVDPINASLSNTDYRIVMLGETHIFVRFTLEQIERLQRERGWKLFSKSAPTLRFI